MKWVPLPGSLRSLEITVTSEELQSLSLSVWDRQDSRRRMGWGGWGLEN